MIDPAICGEVIKLLKSSDADYACNNMPAKFPHGLDCDVFAARHLHDANAEADAPYDREHVTPWIRSREGVKRASLQGPGFPFSAMRWTLDHPEDLDFMRALYEAMGETAPMASAAEYARVCLMRPDITALNSRLADTQRLALSERADMETAPMSLDMAA